MFNMQYAKGCYNLLEIFVSKANCCYLKIKIKKKVVLIELIKKVVIHKQ